jgi:hypothetical protein
LFALARILPDRFRLPSVFSDVRPTVSAAISVVRLPIICTAASALRRLWARRPGRRFIATTDRVFCREIGHTNVWHMHPNGRLPRRQAQLTMENTLFQRSPLTLEFDMSETPSFLAGRSVLATSSAAGIAIVLAVFGGGAISAQDKYTLKVPDGLAFSEFRGYEAWQVVSVSQDGDLIASILANPEMIAAYLTGIPGNGKPFPDGAKMAKIHWNPKKMETFPAATVPGSQHDVDFMVKDSRRFADSGGWGWAVFEYDAASDTFRPGTLADKPPQGNDAKCGFACHTIVKARDYVFTDYGHR